MRRIYVARATAAFPDVRFLIRNVGSAVIGESRVRFGIKGMADIEAIKRPNIHLEIELKNTHTPHTREQKAWQAWCESWGIPYLLLRAQASDPFAQWLDETRRFLLTVVR